MIDNNIVIVLFLILLFILVVVIIYNTLNNKIEKFYVTPTSVARLPSETAHINTVKQTNVSVNPSIYFTGYNIAETCSESVSMDIYSVVSSFNYKDSSSDTILGTLNYDNRNTINLTNNNSNFTYFNVSVYNGTNQSDGSSNYTINPLSGGNYIAIFFPIDDKLYFNNLRIIYSSSGIQNASDVSLYTAVEENTTQSKINTTNVFINGALSISNNGFNEDINNIIIYFPPKCTDISITKMDFMFNVIDSENFKYTTRTTRVMDTDVLLPDSSADFVSTNYNTNVGQFMSIFYRDVPSFIYDFGTIDGCGGSYTVASDGVTVNSISDVFGRFSSTTTINGTNPIIETEYDMYNNVIGKYLKGTTNTTILFPKGTIPQNYTICCVTKYVPRGATERIITADIFNYLIGHWASREGTVFNQNSPNNWIRSVQEDINVNKASSRRWLVTCIKSGGNGTNNLIINGVKYPGDGGNGYDPARMTINGCTLYTNEKSDFGVKYIFIWNKVLSDDKLQIISDNLNAMVNGIPIIFKIDRTKITVNLKDGVTASSAALSAKEIKSIYGTTKNGFYWIKLPDVGAQLTYCIMDDDVYGGGWMLAIQGSSKSTMFHYYSHLWTTNNVTLNTKSIEFMDANGDINLDKIIDAKYDVYNCMNVEDCLALFPGSQTYGNTNIQGKPRYGWTWYSPSALGNYKGITLLEFFNKGYNNFNYSYYCPTTRRNGPGNYMNFSQLLTNIIDVYMPISIWARQYAFMAFGFNYKQIYSNGNCHNVRWGGSFNENYYYNWYYRTCSADDNSNDVSGGIGICKWGDNNDGSAGSRINCCQQGSAPARPMSFQWYIR